MVWGCSEREVGVEEIRRSTRLRHTTFLHPSLITGRSLVVREEEDSGQQGRLVWSGMWGEVSWKDYQVSPDGCSVGLTFCPSPKEGHYWERLWNYLQRFLIVAVFQVPRCGKMVPLWRKMHCCFQVALDSVCASLAWCLGLMFAWSMRKEFAEQIYRVNKTPGEAIYLPENKLFSSTL